MLSIAEGSISTSGHDPSYKRPPWIGKDAQPVLSPFALTLAAEATLSELWRTDGGCLQRLHGVLRPSSAPDYAGKALPSCTACGCA